MTLGPVAAPLLHGGWIALWVVVLAGILVPLGLHRSSPASRLLPVLASLLVLIGGFALRAVVILGSQL